MTDVAVVIPVRDGARYLGEALTSVQAQTLQAAEIVVVDDGSTDDSAAIAAAVPGVRVVTQEAQGAGPTRNAGVDATQAPVIAFLDADDVWPPTALQSLASALGPADLAHGLVTHFVSPDLPEHEAERRVVPAEPLPALMPGGFVVTRAAFAAVGPFRADLAVGEFVDWYARAMDAGLRVAALDEVVLRRRVHARNTGTLRSASQADLTRAVRDTLARRRAAGP
jgi:glycosyltransferase involved in cell wall biosynthesis